MAAVTRLKNRVSYISAHLISKTEVVDKQNVDVLHVKYDRKSFVSDTFLPMWDEAASSGYAYIKVDCSKIDERSGEPTGDMWEDFPREIDIADILWKSHMKPLENPNLVTKYVSKKIQGLDIKDRVVWYLREDLADAIDKNLARKTSNRLTSTARLAVPDGVHGSITIHDADILFAKDGTMIGKCLVEDGITYISSEYMNEFKSSRTNIVLGTGGLSYQAFAMLDIDNIAGDVIASDMAWQDKFVSFRDIWGNAKAAVTPFVHTSYIDMLVKANPMMAHHSRVINKVGQRIADLIRRQVSCPYIETQSRFAVPGLSVGCPVFLGVDAGKRWMLDRNPRNGYDGTTTHYWTSSPEQLSELARLNLMEGGGTASFSIGQNGRSKVSGKGGVIFIDKEHMDGHDIISSESNYKLGYLPMVKELAEKKEATKRDITIVLLHRYSKESLMLISKDMWESKAGDFDGDLGTIACLDEYPNIADEIDRVAAMAGKSERKKVNKRAGNPEKHDDAMLLAAGTAPLGMMVVALYSYYECAQVAMKYQRSLDDMANRASEQIRDIVVRNTDGMDEEQKREHLKSGITHDEFMNTLFWLVQLCVDAPKNCPIKASSIDPEVFTWRWIANVATQIITFVKDELMSSFGVIPTCSWKRAKGAFKDYFPGEYHELPEEVRHKYELAMSLPRAQRPQTPDQVKAYWTPESWDGCALKGIYDIRKESVKGAWEQIMNTDAQCYPLNYYQDWGKQQPDWVESIVWALRDEWKIFQEEVSERVEAGKLNPYDTDEADDVKTEWLKIAEPYWIELEVKHSEIKFMIANSMWRMLHDGANPYSGTEVLFTTFPDECLQIVTLAAAKGDKKQSDSKCVIYGVEKNFAGKNVPADISILVQVLRSGSDLLVVTEFPIDGMLSDVIGTVRIPSNVDIKINGYSAPVPGEYAMKGIRTSKSCMEVELIPA